MPSLSWLQIGLLVLVFVAVSGAVLGISLMLQRNRARERMTRIIEPGLVKDDAPARAAWVETVVKVAAPLARLSVPSEGWEDSGLRRRFMQAGLRGESVPVVFFGLKTALAIGLPALAWFLDASMGLGSQQDSLMMLMVVLMAIGFYLPNTLLSRLIARRQLEIFEAFPDAIDLLTICVEAGLSLEAAIGRVAREMRLKCDELSDELELVTLELRAGAAKDRALRNLALRTAVEDIDTLVAMLIQSEKFGTSIGDSLRIHAEMLRTKRMQRAEEAAAKVAVKLVFPLVLFIFPSILIVVAGPAILSIGKTMPMIFGTR